MRSRGILLHRSLAAVIAVGSLLTSATVANADGVRAQKQKVDQLADQLDNLENRIGQLGEDYGAAARQEGRPRPGDRRLAGHASPSKKPARRAAGVLGDIAVDKYVSGSALELSPLFSNAAAYTEAEQKDSLSRLALDSGSGSTDEMLALAEDLAKEQAALSRKQQQVADLVATPRRQAGRSPGSCRPNTTQKLPSAQADLGAAIEQERERRAEAAAAAEIAKQKQQRPLPRRQLRREHRRALGSRGGASWWRYAAAASSRTERSAPCGSPTPADDGGGGGGGDDPAASRQPSAPPVSSMAGIAVNAAMSQLGVPYRFAAESPGVAFDCSGLTKYAWGQAGRVPAPPVGRTVRIDSARLAERGSARRPRLLQVADRPCRDLHRRWIDDPCAAHRRCREGRRRQLGQGRRNRQTRITTVTVSPCAGHRHRSCQFVARRQHRRRLVAVRFRAHRRRSVQPDLPRHRRQRPAIRAAPAAARPGAWPPLTTWPASTASSQRSVARACPCLARSACAPTPTSRARRST